MIHQGNIPKPLRWPGGQRLSASWIIRHFPQHYRYVEPYFGGGAVLFKKKADGVSEYVNDVNGELTNFWHVLATPKLFDRFVRIVQAIPLGRPVWEWAKEHEGAEDRVARAVVYFVKVRQSRGGEGRDYVTQTRRVRRGMNEQVASWLGAVEGLPEVHRRMIRVEIWQKDGGKALECLKAFNTSETLHYLDPPFLGETRVAKKIYGEFEMSPKDHEELLTWLGERCRAKFALSGYPNPMYAAAAEAYGWRVRTTEVGCSASSAKEKPTRTAALWMNYDPPTGDKA
jgi:DNA adenine methylase